MPSLIRAAVGATSLLFALQAQATVYSFSYTFADRSAITGTLQGDAAGDYVTNISDLHVAFNGTAFSGNLVAGGYDSTTGQFGAAGSAMLSTKAALNEFVFADQDPTAPDPASNYFYFINDPVYGQEVFSVNYNPAIIDSALDHPAEATWSLTAQAADVPEPSSIALMLGALGLLAATRRRRF